MPMPAAASSGDLSDIAKLRQSLSALTSIGSFEDFLAAFGLRDLPPAHQLGLVLGVATFALTCVAVLTLLTLGGSWRRIEQQGRAGASAGAPDAVTERTRRALLLERLLESRAWMLSNNYPTDAAEESDETRPTPLADMLLMAKPVEGRLPEGYEKNYEEAYRACRDRPGGPILGGRPEHRFEAYSRAFAGGGARTSRAHRWSCARLYEALAGASHEADDAFRAHFHKRPRDLVGRTCRLEGLDAGRHARDLWEITSGQACHEHRRYDPEEVWGFLDCGPFETPQALRESEVFRLGRDQAAFAVVASVTGRLLGAVHLTKDDPKNLSVQMELPIAKPSSEDSAELLEACFLLLDRLFAHGYRRVQMCVDTKDVRGRRVPRRLGFTQEGEIPKHMIVKEANRDSLVYGMLNSDWDKGARAWLFGKIHGAAAQKADAKMVAKEEAHREKAEQLKMAKEAEGKQDDKKKM